MNETPALRIRVIGAADVDRRADYVLYWMTAFRRTSWNFSLQRAVAWAAELDKPLVVLEALRVDYPWACDRLHAFVVEGMADNAAVLADRPVLYHPYVEPESGASTGLIAALARRAAVVVTDDYPCFFLPALVRAASRQIRVRFEAVDSNGILPMRATDRVFGRAVDFRRFLQRELAPHLQQFPQADPLERAPLPRLAQLPAAITKRWPAAPVDAWRNDRRWLANMPIDHAVPAVELVGGEVAARQCLRTFVKQKLSRYHEERSEPEQDVASGLSPYLHFGHLSVHEVVHDVLSVDKWEITRLAPKPTGSSAGWWGASEPVESFLDELITWRELGFNMCSLRRDYDRWESLPAWARATLDKHAVDPRPHLYQLADFEQARTHDPLWNAAQRQLVREGRIHNYLRMLWGKKILEWSATPREALDTMIELNNKYALDGRDPNSYSGIFWVLGRYDRPWAPERPIFGQIRYMSSDNTARKFRVKGYLERYRAGRGDERPRGTLPLF